MYKIIENFIPKDNYKRSCLPMDWKYITIHNNANEKSTARNERNYLTNPSNIYQVSWNDCIFENEIIIAIPHNENSWACGDGYNGTGNRKSISIEVCESGDFELTVKNTQLYVAQLLFEKGFGVDRVVQHNKWSGKNCPRLLIPRWGSFINGIQLELNRLNKQTDNTKHWAYKHFESLNKKGYQISEMRFDEAITRGEIFSLLDRITERK